jgi:hypothetical protein
MTRVATLLAIVLALALAPAAGFAQDAGKAKAVPALKVGKDEKVCNYRFQSGPSVGKREVWVCKKDQPCCAWDLISYVKCGSTITGCL